MEQVAGLVGKACTSWSPYQSLPTPTPPEVFAIQSELRALGDEEHLQNFAASVAAILPLEHVGPLPASAQTSQFTDLSVIAVSSNHHSETFFCSETPPSYFAQSFGRNWYAYGGSSSSHDTQLFDSANQNEAGKSSSPMKLNWARSRCVPLMMHVFVDNQYAY